MTNVAFKPHPALAPHGSSARATRKFLQDLLHLWLQIHFDCVAADIDPGDAFEALRPEEQMVVADHLGVWLKGHAPVVETADLQAILLGKALDYFEARYHLAKGLGDLDTAFHDCLAELKIDNLPISRPLSSLFMGESPAKAPWPLGPVGLLQLFACSIQLDLPTVGAMIAADYMDFLGGRFDGVKPSYRILPERCQDPKDMTAFFASSRA